MAYHEAGHAVIAYVLGIDDIEIEVTQLGACTTSRATLAPTIQRAVLIDFAGRQAEEQKFGSASDIGSASDDQRAAETINELGVSKSIGYGIISRQLDTIEGLLKHGPVWEAIESLAVHLLGQPLPWRLPHAERLISSWIRRDEALTKVISKHLSSNS